MNKPPLGLNGRANVMRVIDGDTVDLELRLPFRVRLKDCWAPEVRGPESVQGEAAKEFLKRLLPVDLQVEVQIETGEADELGDVFTFGRLVGIVRFPGDDESVNDLMVQAGHATREKVR